MNVRTHIRLHSVSSTNAFAQFLVSAKRPAEGTVISAHDQFAGRGQAGKTWHVSPGQNITMSMIMYPEFMPVNRQFKLNKLLSVSVARSLDKYLDGVAVRIKWPNDLLISGQKLAGLLIQSASSGNRMRYAILGMGINVYEEDFPADMKAAVSLSAYADHLPRIADLAVEVSDAVWTDYEKFRSGRYRDLDDAYAEKLFGRDQVLPFATPQGETFRGEVRGVEPSGKLMIRTDEGIRTFSTGELRFDLSV